MVKGTTSTGFEFEIKEEDLDNYELIEKLEEITNGNGLAIAGVPKMLLGEEQEKALKDHVRQMNGRVTASGMLKEVWDIFNYDDSTKNS